MRPGRFFSTLAILSLLSACGGNEDAITTDTERDRMSGIAPRNVRIVPEDPPEPPVPPPVVINAEGECVPLTCEVAAAEFGIECGTQSDGCDGTIDCGDPCEAPQTCGGGGEPNLCGCPDGDLDGHCDSQDNCVDFPNPSQNDIDADGVGDGCDRCPLDADNDHDGDNRCGNVDNCPGAFNPDQADGDSDGQGDACDAFTCPMVLDFEVDDNGVPILAGTKLTTQFAGRGVTSMSCENNRGPDVCLAFDSGNPTGGDFDLFSPIDGMIAIIAENVTDSDGDGLVDDPDDEARGGAFVIEMAQPSLITSLGIRDIDLDEPDAFSLWCDTEMGVVNIPIPALGNNSFQEVPVELPGVTSVRIEIPSSGGLVSMSYCPACEPTTCEAEGKNCESIPDGCGGTLFCGDCPSGESCGGGGEPNVCGCDDGDGDGVCDGDDNCPVTANTDQLNTDGDAAGNACDDDDDNDGIADGSDLDPLDPGMCVDMDMDLCDDCTFGADGLGPLPDFDKANDGPDEDGDGLCDAGDPCGADPQNDIDGDGLCADEDNCPDVPNPDQTDTNGDGIGDACEPCMGDPADDDFDSVCNGDDNCPSVFNTSQADHDEDGLGDLCDADRDNDGVPSDQDCDDFNDAVFPGAEEFCDELDSDCDGSFVDDCPFLDLNSDGLDDRVNLVLNLGTVSAFGGAAPLAAASSGDEQKLAFQAAALTTEPSDFDNDGTSDYEELQEVDANVDGFITPQEMIDNQADLPDSDGDGYADVVENDFVDTDSDGVFDTFDPVGDLMPETPLWIVDVELEADFTSVRFPGDGTGDVVVTTLPDDVRIAPVLSPPVLLLEGRSKLNARFLLLHGTMYAPVAGTEGETPLLFESRQTSALSELGATPSWYGVEIPSEFGTGGTFSEFELTRCEFGGDLEYRVVQGAFVVNEWVLTPTCVTGRPPATPVQLQEPGSFSGYLFAKRFGSQDRFSLGFLNSVVDDTPNILDFINIEYDTMEQHECVAAGLEPCPAGFVDSGTGELPFTFAYRQVTNAEIPDITGSGGVPVGPAFEIPADMLRHGEPFEFPGPEDPPLEFRATVFGNDQVTYMARLSFRPLVVGTGEPSPDTSSVAISLPIFDPVSRGRENLNEFTFSDQGLLQIPVSASRRNFSMAEATAQWGREHIRWEISEIGDSHETITDANGEVVPKDGTTDFRWCERDDSGTDPFGCTVAQIEGEHTVGIGWDPVAKFIGLPEENSGFGRKQVRVGVDGAPLLGTGTNGRIEVFFLPQATNHPPSTGGTKSLFGEVPNWLYYWTQNTCLPEVFPGLTQVMPILYFDCSVSPLPQRLRDKCDRGTPATTIFLQQSGTTQQRWEIAFSSEFERTLLRRGRVPDGRNTTELGATSEGGWFISGIQLFQHIMYHEATHWDVNSLRYPSGPGDITPNNDGDGLDDPAEALINMTQVEQPFMGCDELDILPQAQSQAQGDIFFGLRTDRSNTDGFKEINGRRDKNDDHEDFTYWAQFTAAPFVVCDEDWSRLGAQWSDARGVICEAWKGIGEERCIDRFALRPLPTCEP